jgi:hypothetical protein
MTRHAKPLRTIPRRRIPRAQRHGSHQIHNFHPLLDFLEPDGLLAVSIIESCSGVSEREELRKIEVAASRS